MQRELFFHILRHPQRPDLLLRFKSPGPRQNDHRLLGIEAADLSQDREAIHPWHFQIEHNDISLCSAKDLQAFLTTVSKNYVISLPTEERVEKITDSWLIINRQNFGNGISRGNQERD